MKQKEKPYLRLYATITGQLVHQLETVFPEHLPLWTEAGWLSGHTECTICTPAGWQLPATGQEHAGRHWPPFTVPTLSCKLSHYHLCLQAKGA